MTYIFIFITFLWLLEFVLFPSLAKDNRSNKRSFATILISILAIIIINAIMFFNGLLLVNSHALKVVSLILYSSGLILRYWSLILLGKNFSRKVEVEDEQELVSKGTYRYIRHPLYLGLFLLTISVPLFVGNIIMFLIAIVVMFVSISIRIKEEEAYMEEVLGSRYKFWKEERYKFLPFIY